MLIKLIKMNDRIYRPKEASNYLGISIASLWRLEKSGALKNKRIISRGAVGWLKSDLDNYLDEVRQSNLKAYSE